MWADLCKGGAKSKLQQTCQVVFGGQCCLIWSLGGVRAMNHCRMAANNDCLALANPETTILRLTKASTTHGPSPCSGFLAPFACAFWNTRSGQDGSALWETNGRHMACFWVWISEPCVSSPGLDLQLNPSALFYRVLIQSVLSYEEETPWSSCLALYHNMPHMGQSVELLLINTTFERNGETI